MTALRLSDKMRKAKKLTKRRRRAQKQVKWSHIDDHKGYTYYAKDQAPTIVLVLRVIIKSLSSIDELRKVRLALKKDKSNAIRPWVWAAKIKRGQGRSNKSLLNIHAEGVEEMAIEVQQGENGALVE